MRATVDLYIKSILQEAPVLALPGIGTLRKRFMPSTMNAEIGKILPPSVKLEFSTQVDRDATIANQLVRYLNMPIREAQAVELEIVRELKERFRQGGSYYFEGLGYLRGVGQSEVRFQADDSSMSELAGDFFGLKPVEIPDMPVRTLSLSQAENESSMGQSGIYSSRNSRGIGWKTFLLLLLLPVLGGSLVWFGPFSKPRSSMHAGANKNIAPAPASLEGTNGLPQGGEPIRIEESIALSETPVSDKVDTDPTEGAVNLSENSEPESGPDENARLGVSRGGEESSGGFLSNETDHSQSQSHLRVLAQGDESSNSHMRRDGTRTRGVEPADEGAAAMYFLIVGSYHTAEGAQDFMEELSDKGYRPTQLISNEGGKENYRIAIYGNEDRSKVEAMSNIIKGRGFSSPWIYTLQ